MASPKNCVHSRFGFLYPGNFLPDCVTSNERNDIEITRRRFKASAPAGQTSRERLGCVSRLREFGKWLRTNGEAMYDTHPWVRSEGKTLNGEFIRFTQKADALYAILLAKPNTHEISIESLRLKDGTQVQMLGVNGNLSWTSSGENLTVTLPNELPGDYAYALKISPKPV